MYKKLAAYLFFTINCLGLIACSAGGGSGRTPVNNNLPLLPEIKVTPITSNSALPALQLPIIATYGDYWLIMGGLNGPIHGFSNTNPNIYVYNPKTNQIFSENIFDTDIALPVKQQLMSAATNFLHYKNTLYVTGGYYNPSNESTTFTTLNTISSFNVPNMVNAIINHQTNLAQYINYNTSISQFQVTGGQLGIIGNDFYLAFGQDCEGGYCQTSQTYTNTIYKFRTDPNLSFITIESTIFSPESTNSGFRRRDFNLVPFIQDGVETLLAMGGPFTPASTPTVWTNGIMFNQALQYNNNFINQQANQYTDAHLSMYSAQTNSMFVANFSGISNLYWTESGLVYNPSAPLGNILDLISYNNGNVQEYANNQPMCGGQPLSNCQYMGTSAVFIPASGVSYDNRWVLQLDNISGKTLVGYIYGGLTASQQEVLRNGGSSTTNQVYAVYVGAPILKNNWTNITNLYQGN